MKWWSELTEEQCKEAIYVGIGVLLVMAILYIASSW